MIKAGYSNPADKKSPSAAPKKGAKDNYSMNIRKISNGWLVRESWEEGQGQKRSYKENETFHDKDPMGKDKD